MGKFARLRGGGVFRPHPTGGPARCAGLPSLLRRSGRARPRAPAGAPLSLRESRPLLALLQGTTLSVVCTAAARRRGLALASRQTHARHHLTARAVRRCVRDCALTRLPGALLARHLPAFAGKLTGERRGRYAAAPEPSPIPPALTPSFHRQGRAATPPGRAAKAALLRSARFA